MKDPPLVRRILDAVRRAVSIPLTIKIRSGWDPSGQQALKISRLAEACGVDAVAVHPRTATQGFRGSADWKVIAAVKRALSIPVIGNGDITDPADALRMLSDTGCDAVMVGRAAIGNPMIFGQILSAVREEPVAEIDERRRFLVMLDYLADSVRYIGESTACPMMRSRLCWFVKGMRNAGQFRNSIRFIESQQEAEALIREYAASLGVTMD
jgi:nifR3 family TIM-barrel protein